MAEIGARIYVINLDGFFTKKDHYFQWALNRCVEKGKKHGDIITPEALKFFSDAMETPLQIVHYFNNAIEIGFNAGIKPLDKSVIEQVLKPTGSEIELKYARLGYRASTIAKMLYVPEKLVHQWFMGKLPEQQAFDMEEALIQANIIV